MQIAHSAGVTSIGRDRYPSIVGLPPVTFEVFGLSNMTDFPKQGNRYSSS